ncbi:hypothetical protein BH18THE1_BH18THE1_20620 [soil metagenome]
MQEIFHQKEYDAALYYYELAQSEEPDNEMIVYDMAYLHYLFNELQVAVDYFTLAIELKPDFELAIHNRAKLIEKIANLRKYSMVQM